MEELLLTLLLWINQNSELEYDISGGLPRVIQVERADLVDQLSGKSYYRGKVDNTLAYIAAYYDHERVTIYLDVQIDPRTIHGRSALVHELVHFIQYQQGIATKVTCVNELERLAYGVQGDYLRRGGAKPEFDEFTVQVRSLCIP